ELECEIIDENHLPAYFTGNPIKASAHTQVSAPLSDKLATISASRLTDKVRQMEKETIMDALENHQYNITLTAQALGIKRQALQYKLSRYGIVKKP
ncbi:helix-turn-helix domain-containing protein, partial [Paenibacillus sp. TAF58]